MCLFLVPSIHRRYDGNAEDAHIGKTEDVCCVRMCKKDVV